MMSLHSAINIIINGTKEYCCLCYKIIEKNAFHLQDQIVNNSEDVGPYLSEILEYILCADVSGSLSQYDSICQECTKQAKNTFIFLKMCEENSIQFSKIINNLTNSLEYSKSCNSIFISLKKDLSVKTHYDCKKRVKSHSQAFKRYKSITNKKYKRRQEFYYDYDSCITPKGYDIENENNLDIKTKKVKSKVSIPTSEMTCDSNSYKCKGCLKLYPSAQHLRQHFIRVHAPKQFKCPKCPRCYASETLLEKHKSDSHSPVVCSECGKTYAHLHSLKLHEAGHKMKVTCQLCGRAYKNHNTFKKHLQLNICQQRQRKSNLEAKFMCDYCEKKFCHKPTLRVHIQFEHGNGKAYACTWCDKKFHAQSRLKAHTVTHTQEKKFYCEICGGKFVTKESLLYHTRIHTGEKPYQCHLCERMFLSSSRRAEHVRRHHVGPTLECEICHHKFKGKSCLEKHRKRHLNPKSRLHCVQNVS